MFRITSDLLNILDTIELNQTPYTTPSILTLTDANFKNIDSNWEQKFTFTLQNVLNLINDPSIQIKIRFTDNYGIQVTVIPTGMEYNII